MLNVTDFIADYKELYSKQRVRNMTYKKNPFLAVVEKQTDFEGKYYPQPLIYGDPQNRSATFSQAVSLDTSALAKSFLVTRAKDYGLASIETEALLASQSDKGAFMKAVTVSTNGAINSLSRSQGIKAYRDGFGAIGNVSAPGASTTLTLTSRFDVTNFEVGNVLVFAQTAGTTALRNSGASLTVTAINRSAGTMTVSANVNTITGITDGDFIFIKGDRQDSATPARLVISGLEAWLPTTAPTSGDSFFGVDRSTDVTRLAGLRLDATGVPLEEALIEASSQVALNGGDANYAWCSFDKYAALEKSLGSKVNYIDLKINAQIGFRGIRVSGATREINVMPDYNCPSTKCYVLTMETWKLLTLGEHVQLNDIDGLQMLRLATLDGVQMRWFSFGNLVCDGPGWNMNMTW